MLISIIVPVYKVEKYLKRCVDSILAQTFSDFELILVDDGSPDNCGAICDEYAKQDKRIVVIHKSNGGTASARNAGLNIAQGKWIIFCDSDDFYDTSSLFELILLIQNVKNENCLIGYNFRNVWPDHIEQKGPYPSAYEQMKEKADNIKFVSSSKSHNMMGFAMWDKLYSKEIIDHYSLRVLERDKVGNKDDWADDLFFNLQYMMCVQEMRTVEIAPYCLRKHGRPEDQSEDTLVGRMNHMLNLFCALEKTKPYQEEKLKHEFWKIVIWHMKRYFYLDVGTLGIKGLRQECVSDEHYNELKLWISSAQKNWKKYSTRWDEKQAKDYRYLLDYLIDGNLIKYKVRNKILWR